MDKNIAIEFDNVGKQYRLGLVGTGSLQHDLNRWWQTSVLGKEDPYLKIGEVNDRSTKGHSDYVWALKDISFKVEQGDVVGIIGKNGAGKSTLLKLLSHITAPTTGHISYRGRIASLLEVGTGFHPEMTARENIYMNGSIMGMSRSEINRKLDEIIDFAGIERYIDTPVKRFSSGMTVRLGFAVAAFLEPEILVVDEVLAVGDAEFQKKAIGKMKDVSQGGGRTVLFVSHNMAAVRHLCEKGIVLKNGMIDFVGTADEAVNHYMSSNVKIIDNHNLSSLHRPSMCSREIQFTSFEFLNEKDEEIQPRCGSYLKIRLGIEVKESKIDSCEFSLDITSMFGSLLMSLPSNMVIEPKTYSKGTNHVDCIFQRLPLSAGSYIISPWVSYGKTCGDFIEEQIKMDVVEDDFYCMGRSFDPHLLGKIVLSEYSWRL